MCIKRFFSDLAGKIDRMMVKKSKKKCSCKCGEKDDDGCCK